MKKEPVSFDSKRLILLNRNNKLTELFVSHIQSQKSPAEFDEDFGYPQGSKVACTLLKKSRICK